MTQNGPNLSPSQTKIGNICVIFDYLGSLFGQGKNIVLCVKIILQKLTAFVFGSTYVHQTLQKKNV